MVIEEKPQLSFLDVLVHKKGDSILGNYIFIKNTHMNRYLNTKPQHHPPQLQKDAGQMIIKTSR